jgi:hypothetical protein
MEKIKKPFKETVLGKFLAGKGFNTIMDVAGSLIPGVAMLDNIKDKVLGSGLLSPEDHAEFTRLYELELQELDKRLADTADARSMYQFKNAMADVVAKRVINWNLPVVFILVAALVAATILLKDNVLLALISSAIGGVTAQLLSERLTIVNFFFGSSLGSQRKTDLLNKNDQN